MKYKSSYLNDTTGEEIVTSGYFSRKGKDDYLLEQTDPGLVTVGSKRSKTTLNFNGIAYEKMKSNAFKMNVSKYLVFLSKKLASNKYYTLVNAKDYLEIIFSNAIAKKGGISKAFISFKSNKKVFNNIDFVKLQFYNGKSLFVEFEKIVINK